MQTTSTRSVKVGRHKDFNEILVSLEALFRKGGLPRSVARAGPAPDIEAVQPRSYEEAPFSDSMPVSRMVIRAWNSTSQQRHCSRCRLT